MFLILLSLFSNSEAVLNAYLKVLQTFDDDLDDEDSGEEDEDVKPELPPPLGQEAATQTIQPMDGELFLFSGFNAISKSR